MSTRGRPSAELANQVDDASTEPRPRRKAGISLDSEQAWSLTIVWHPDLRRVGEVATQRLSPGDSLVITRCEPEFAKLDRSGVGRAPLTGLDTKRVSRSAGTTVTRGDHEISIAVDSGQSHKVALRVDGAPVASIVRVPTVAAGALLELAGSVWLWLAPERPAPAGADVAALAALVGVSAGMTRLREELFRMRRGPQLVLLRGQTGTGKELAARAIQAIVRPDGPFVAMNCANFPSDLAVAELMGYERGAFTGATTDYAGLIRQADGGVLLLDEFGELSAVAQASLLRFMDERRVRPMMSRPDRRDRAARVDQEVDIWLILATNQDLENMCQDKAFRVDLLARCAGREVRLAPLCERRPDVLVLLAHALQFEAGLFETEEEAPAVHFWAPEVIEPEVLRRFLSAAWPANARGVFGAARVALALRGEGCDREVSPRLLAYLAQQERLAPRSPDLPAFSMDATALPPASVHPSESELRAAFDEGLSLRAVGRRFGRSHTWARRRRLELFGSPSGD